MTAFSRSSCPVWPLNPKSKSVSFHLSLWLSDFCLIKLWQERTCQSLGETGLEMNWFSYLCVPSALKGSIRPCILAPNLRVPQCRVCTHVFALQAYFKQPNLQLSKKSLFLDWAAVNADRVSPLSRIFRTWEETILRIPSSVWVSFGISLSSLQMLSLCEFRRAVFQSCKWSVDMKFTLGRLYGNSHGMDFVFLSFIFCSFDGIFLIARGNKFSLYAIDLQCNNHTSHMSSMFYSRITSKHRLTPRK